MDKIFIKIWSSPCCIILISRKSIKSLLELLHKLRIKLHRIERDLRGLITKSLLRRETRLGMRLTLRKLKCWKHEHQSNKNDNSYILTKILSNCKFYLRKYIKSNFMYTS